MSSNIEIQESELNQMTGQGKILDALATYYADDCTFEEANGGRRASQQAQHEYLSSFFKTLKAFKWSNHTWSSRGEGLFCERVDI